MPDQKNSKDAPSSAFFELKENVFYRTPPAPCSYLPDRIEERMLTPVSGEGGEDTVNFLTEHGFRRSQYYLYKPICANCRACLSLRIPANDFIFRKSHRRIFRQSEHLRRKIVAPKLTEEQFAVFRNYIEARHGEDDMAEMEFSDLQKMVEDTPTQTFITEYRNPQQNYDLFGWVLCDALYQGISMVYSVFHPDFSKNSPGSFAVLDHIRELQRQNRKYLYLGYWVPQSRKMDYKKKFAPFEIRLQDTWLRFETTSAAEQYFQPKQENFFLP